MDVEPSHGHPVLATGVPVAVIAVMHLAISTAIIAVVDPDVPDLVPYWVMSVLLPAIGWALLVIGRAAVWRATSAFWLGGSAGIIVLAAFVASLVLYLGNARLGDISARGVPLALIYSSWVLLGCAVFVAVVLRALGRHVDAPIDAQEEPALGPAEQGADATEPPPAEDDIETVGQASTERR